jgi:mono/diheme cytochrome c family protein
MTDAPRGEEVADAQNLSRIDVYLDGSAEPIVSYRPPVSFELDSTQLEDGDHVLRIEAYDSNGVKGVRTVPFSVRNGPGIAVHGLTPGDVLDGKVPILVNAYGGATEKRWEPSSAETPAPIPTWTWVLVLFIVAFGVFYAVRHWNPSEDFANTPTFGGSAVAASAAGTAGTAGSAGDATAVSDAKGATLYSNLCSACHQSSGQGLPGVFPPLAGDPVVLDPDPSEHISVVLHGKQGSVINGVAYASAMPAFAAQLSDEDVAAVINHERTSWGNSAPTVSAADVAALR